MKGYAKMYKYLILLIVLISGCGGSAGEDPGTGGEGGTGGTDDRVSCASDRGCDDGTFCLNGFCTFACEDDLDCSGTETCNVRGRCVPFYDDGGEGGTGGSNVCQDVQVTPNRVVPDIHIIVDRSGSMGWEFDSRDVAAPGESRYDAVYEALVNGVLPQMEGLANFELTLYWDERNEGVCPEIATSTGSDIQSVLESNFPEQGMYTPTAEAIWDVLDRSPEVSLPAVPTVFLLATDGEPNGCGDRNQDHLFNSVAAVQEAATRGIETYVLGVTEEAGLDHLQDLAEAGGQDTFYGGNDAAQLNESFEEIITRNIACEILLDETIVNVGDDCAGGTATLDAVEIECGVDWFISGPNTIQLDNGACDDFKSGQEFAAQFPCGSVLVE